MATVTIQRRKKKDGTTSYPVYFVDPFTGKKKYHATFRTLKDAQLATHTLRDVIDKGSAPEVRRKARGLTLGEIGELCRATWREREAGEELRPATLKGYLDHLNGLLRFERAEILPNGETVTHPPLQTLRVAQLTPEMVKSVRMGMAAKISAVTANRRIFILKELCARALKDGEIARNPCADIGYLSEKKHQRTSFLAPAELDRLLLHAGTSRTGYLEAAILMGAEHGASLQEILSLKWADIDFQYEESGSITFFRTKNERRRTMLLMPRTRKALLQWREKLIIMRRKRGMPEALSGYVCCRLNGAKVSGLKHSWENVKQAAGVEDFHFHDLRHTFCSSIIMAGGDIKTASEMIGHADIRMTNRYTHLSQLAYQNMQTKLAKFYQAAPQSKELTS